MSYTRKNHPPPFPALTIRNLTNQVLYIGINAANTKGFYLNKFGRTGDSITVYGVDFTDDKTVKTLKRLAGTGKILVTLAQNFYQSLAITSPATTPITTSPP